ncbi:MAG: hypothetical protein IKI97_13445 [Clostridia bacterium]|nr:hypothetical protein [Clostridia bacterium]
MTEKLYYNDSYIKEFCAKVVSCTEKDGKCAVVLDKTAFFPEGGGQYADSGKIGGSNVLDVQISKDGVITHYVDSPLTSGIEYFCELDFEKRFRKMQNHTGEHIVSGLVHSLFGLDNVGFHLGNDDVTMDYNGVLTREDLLEIEFIANKACAENIDVVVKYPSPDELEKLTYRSKLELTEDVRIVDVPGYDSCACCAPHVDRTGEVGMIKLLDFIKYKGGVRVHMKCGFDALEDFNDKYRNVAKIAENLSVKQTEASVAVERLLSELSAKKRECAEIMARYISEKIGSLDFCEGNLVVFEDNLEADAQRIAANLGRTKCSGVFGVFTGNDKDGYRYILSSENVKLRSFVKENIKLAGGGGGSDEMMQGMFKCTKEEIAKAFS